jgi:hypothetical protein
MTKDSEISNLRFQRTATAKAKGDLILLEEAGVEFCIDFTNGSLDAGGDASATGETATAISPVRFNCH